MFRQVASSMITAVYYDHLKDMLQVTYQSGHCYVYFNVPFEIYHQLLNAPSKGKYMHENIFGVYDYASIFDETLDI